jgi:transcriptional regulator with XRE-family HTH domain
MMLMLADVLKSLREERGLDLFELSRLSGLGIATLHSYESGKAPTLINLMRLAKVLGVSLASFDGVELPRDARHRNRALLQAVS